MFYVKHVKKRSLINMPQIKYSTKSVFLVTLINHLVIDSENPVKVCLEMFFHSNLMDNVSSSLFAYCVPFLYTSPAKMPHKFFMGFISELLPWQSRTFTELASNGEYDA